jgi:hypothetical protein
MKTLRSYFSYLTLVISGLWMLSHAESMDHQIISGSSTAAAEQPVLPSSFSLTQSLDTSSARCLHYFTISSNEYVAVAQLSVNIPGLEVKNLNSGDRDQAGTKIYKKMPEGYELIQTLDTRGSEDVVFYDYHGQKFLAVASIGQGKYPNFNSKTKSSIYRWRGDQFELFQTFDLEGAKHVAMQVINNRLYAFFSTGVTINDGSAAPSQQSPIYVLDPDTNQFTLVQSIPTYFAYVLDPFVLDGATYLSLVDAQQGTTIYRMNGKLFEPYQVINQEKNDRHSAVFQTDGKTYLIKTNLYSGTTLYRWQDGRFHLTQTIDTEITGANGITIYQKNGTTLAFIAHYIGGTRNLPEVKTKSSIYRWDGDQFNFVTYYPSLASSSTEAWSGLDQQSYIGVANQSTVNFDYRTPSKIYRVNIESLSKND